jgi:cobyrinic acid a,c-diamide synthase
VPFDPLDDTALPAGTRGIYLGGGFPEVYAGELAANRPLLRELGAAVADGVPTVAECAGLLYLTEALDGVPMVGAIAARAAMTERLTLRYPTATTPGDSLLGRAGEQVTGHEFHRTASVPTAGPHPAWTVDGRPTGFAGPTLHASYLHVHWAGHPRLAQRFADAAGDFPGSPGKWSLVGHTVAPKVTPLPEKSPTDPLRHHGDAETGPGLVDLAVNVYDAPRPGWLDEALHAAIDAADAYPDPAPARAALARHHGRAVEEVLPTAGAAEAFTLLARMRPWRRPVVVHPQFTEPHAALAQAGHHVTAVLGTVESGFALDPAAVPDDADLVVLGNPTNPTGVLHPASTVRALQRPGRTLVVDEAFMDAVPGEAESLAGARETGLLVIRSLTKHWSIPGIRAGYVVGDPTLIAELARAQTPWSVSTPAIAAMLACTGPRATRESGDRAATIARWRDELEAGLRERGIEHVPSAAPFVLARLGPGTRHDLREHGIAVRRADTFPGLDDAWARLAVRPPHTTARLLTALDQLTR